MLACKCSANGSLTKILIQRAGSLAFLQSYEPVGVSAAATVYEFQTPLFLAVEVEPAESSPARTRHGREQTRRVLRHILEKGLAPLIRT